MSGHHKWSSLKHKRRERVWDDLAAELEADRLSTVGRYDADTGEHVIEFWMVDGRHFRVFVGDVQEVNE